MKKKLIAAGAASLAVAAMPVVGVFAAPTLSHTDTINLTISPVCTLGTVTNGVADDGADSTSHGQGTIDGSDPVAYNGSWTGNTLAVTMAAGTTQSNIGTTTFTIRCNNSNGYTLKAKSGTHAENSSSTDLATLVSGNNKIFSGNGDSFVAATSDSYWNFKLGAATGGISISSGYTSAHIVPIDDATVVATGTNGNLNDGQSVTVTYGAGINNTQPSGTYTGTVLYTLVPAADS